MGDLFPLGIDGEDGSSTRYRHPKLFMRQTMAGDRARLRIGIQGFETFRALVDLLPEPFWVLYLLIVPRNSEHEPGRYQAPEPLSRPELNAFLDEFGPALGSDGRHHLWIKSVEGPDLLVYDQHQIVYAYGNLDAVQVALEAQGYEPGEVLIPSPHMHHYHAANDEAIGRLLSRYEWLQTPLQPSDDP